MLVLTEFGMGTSLRRGDYTEAAVRALRDALWHNSIRAAEVFGREKDEMQLAVTVGVQAPGAVDTGVLAEVFPYGAPRIEVVQGGLDVPHPDGEGRVTVMASVAIAVRFAQAGANA